MDKSGRFDNFDAARKLPRNLPGPEDSLLPDLIAALIITAGLFVGSLGVFEGLANHEPEPSHMPECKDRHQTSFDEVLRCPE
jgi:hypothetical protein